VNRKKREVVREKTEARGFSGGGGPRKSVAINNGGRGLFTLKSRKEKE